MSYAAMSYGMAPDVVAPQKIGEGSTYGRDVARGDLS